MTEPRQPSYLIPFAITAAVIAAFTLVVQMVLVPEVRRTRTAQENLAREVQRVGDLLQAMRFERNPGSGFASILEHLRHWCGQMEKFGNSLVERGQIDRHLDEGMEALRGLGAGAADQVEQAFRQATGDKDDELRLRLLRTLGTIAPERGKVLAEACLRRAGVQVSMRIRILSADELLRLDADRAGIVLKDVLLTEYARAMRPEQVMVSGTPTHMDVTDDPSFYNYVVRFMQSSYPQKEQVLLQMINFERQDVTTLQEIIDGLAQLKSRDAVPRIKSLFESRNASPFSQPMFRRKCATALAAILGSDACAYLREQLGAEPTDQDLVRRALQRLIAENCGS